MSTPPRDLPRFVPTLTEVVQPPVVGADEMVRGVMRELNLVLERRLREETGRLQLAMQQELELLLRQAVVQALSAREQSGGAEKKPQ